MAADDDLRFWQASWDRSVADYLQWRQSREQAIQRKIDAESHEGASDGN
jgi:hypothetical protein